MDLHRQNVVAELLVECHRRRISFDVAGGGEHQPGAESVVSSAEYFMAGDREGTQAVCCSRPRGIEDEGCLRLVELARDELHRRIVERIRVEDDVKGIPAEHLGGKDIDPVEFQAGSRSHGWLFP
jgi:hypothetical protein